MGREDKFFKMCITLPFEEKKDTRDETSVPELVKVAQARDDGLIQDAIDYGKTLVAMYPDNDLVPFMISYMYFQRHFPDEALQMAVEAIPRCPRKYRLYAVAGLAEFDRGKLPESVVWWSRSIIAQCKVTDFQEFEPFLYFSELTKMLGMKETQAFHTMADAIEPDMPALTHEEIQKLERIKNSWAKKPFKQVVKHINETYLQG